MVAKNLHVVFDRLFRYVLNAAVSRKVLLYPSLTVSIRVSNAAALELKPLPWKSAPPRTGVLHFSAKQYTCAPHIPFSGKISKRAQTGKLHIRC